MNTKNFKCFQVLYEEKNLVPAAKKLFMSPQGLGKLIKNLEDELDTPLFIRSKDGFLPTDAGILFYEKCLELEKSFRDLMINLENVRNREKRFQIGFSSGSIRVIDINKIQKFMDENPAIVGAWYEQDNAMVKERVLNGELGFGFAIGAPEDDRLKGELIKSEDMVLYVYRGHPLFDREEISVEEIKGDKIISMASRYRIHQDFLTACHMNGFHPNIVGNVNEGFSIFRLVENRVGLGVSPKILPDSDDVRAVKLKGEYSWDVYGIYREDGADVELAKKLIAFIK